MRERDLTKYIGKEYEKYNCFDLVRDFYLDVFELDLKNYFEGKVVPDRRVVNSLIVSNKGDFVQVPDPQYGDIVLIKLYGIESHIGVFIGKGLFIHSIRGAGSGIERTEKYKHMIAGYFRHREKVP